MRELLEQVRAWQAEGVGLGRAVVVRTFGSAPRPAGASLVATADGRLAGSVSGGCVEGAALDEIRRARAEGVQRLVRYGISDEQAREVGLSCGGTIDVLVEPFVRPEILAAAAGRGGAAVVIPLPGDSSAGAPAAGERGPGAPPAAAWSIAADGSATGSSGSVEADAAIAGAARAVLADGGSTTVEVGGRQWFVEGFAPPPRLVVAGAVQLALPLVRIARELGYSTVVVDGRAAFATRERFPEADEILIGWLDEVAGEIGLGRADAVAVLAHDAKLDEPAIVEALRRGCRYVGAIGSRRMQADRRARLLAAGVGEADLARLRGPIGLDLGGREPAETALAIMAEVVAERRGGSGVPMSTRARA